jgi:uncharacterized protein YjiS (DUF1127 family)
MKLLARILAIARWWKTRREAARLSRHPDRMLKDIGVSRGGIQWAVRCGRGSRGQCKQDAAIYTGKWSIQNEVHP